MKKVRFDLVLPQGVPDQEVRLAARAFVKKQGDEVAGEVTIKGGRNFIAEGRKLRRFFMEVEVK